MNLNFNLYTGTKNKISAVDNKDLTGGLIVDSDNNDIYIVNSDGKAIEVNTQHIAEEVNNTLVSQGLSYVRLDGTSYQLAGVGSCKDADLVIPAYVNGEPVKSIGSQAFEGNSNIISIDFPETIETIEEGSFVNMPKLTKVRFRHKNSLPDIDEYQFAGSPVAVVIYEEDVTNLENSVAFIESDNRGSGNTIRSTKDVLVTTSNNNIIVNNYIVNNLNTSSSYDIDRDVLAGSFNSSNSYYATIQLNNTQPITINNSFNDCLNVEFTVLDDNERQVTIDGGFSYNRLNVDMSDLFDHKTNLHLVNKPFKNIDIVTGMTYNEYMKRVSRVNVEDNMLYPLSGRVKYLKDFNDKYQLVSCGQGTTVPYGDISADDVKYLYLNGCKFEYMSYPTVSHVHCENVTDSSFSLSIDRSLRIDASSFCALMPEYNSDGFFFNNAVTNDNISGCALEIFNIKNEDLTDIENILPSARVKDYVKTLVMDMDDSNITDLRLKCFNSNMKYICLNMTSRPNITFDAYSFDVLDNHKNNGGSTSVYIIGSTLNELDIAGMGDYFDDVQKDETFNSAYARLDNYEIFFYFLDSSETFDKNIWNNSSYYWSYRELL